ncbi:MAG: sensor histidine kinase [Winogradskyella sp.]|uniref:Tetratricopeptide repeat protein n=1 Tax=Winogradskyella poriferorum TaxID=307627 RepID=A0ABU7W8Q0_9FLAO|nr:sensor histidine kinase [Winogradskyella sp.]|tara:strand:- start:144 stop:2069 length:1926 start_codon:yes stop_codon:yes gene_type:complete
MTLKNHPSTFLCGLLITILTLSHVKAQEKVIDSLINAKVQNYEAVNNLLKPFSNDSLVIDSFYKKSQKRNYTFGQAYAANLMGIYCRNTSQYDKAINYHNESVNLARANNYTDLDIIGLNMLGVVYRRTDAIRTALDYHQEALAIAEKVDPRTGSIKKSIAVSLNSMGNIYLALDQFEIAIERFSKSLKIEKEVDNKLGLAINYHNIGYAKEGLGKLDEALEYYQKSLEYNTEINSKLGKVICNSSIGGIFIKKNKDEEAIELMTSILKEANDLRDKFHLTGVYSSLGWAYLKTENYKKAKYYLNKSEELATEYSFKSSLEENYRYLALLAEKEGDYEKAYEYEQLSRDFSDELRKEKNFQYVNDIIIKYDTEKISDKLKSIEQEREIEKLRYRKNKNILVASCLVLFLIIIISYILYRQRFLQNEKHILTLEQDILRSQMNPHFVFNSLNSIKQYIITNEQKQAVFYLNKFAKLIRKILEASKTKEVSLAEEIETIELYFSIENIRFSNEIVLNTYIDDDIDLHSIRLPSLVLQPFIENSIWHGLSSKKGKKQIDIEVTKESSDFVLIKIIDNGIGREQSAHIKENKVIKRKSLGLNLTKERLTNFVKDFKNKFTLRFVDLKDSNNKPKGTKVILELPIK